MAGGRSAVTRESSEKQKLIPDAESLSALVELAEQERLRDMPPLRYCLFIAEHPKLAFGLTATGHLMMVVATGILALAHYDIITIKNLSDSTMDIRTSDDYLRDVAWKYRQQTNETVVRGYPSKGTQSLRSHIGDCIELYFERENGNVLTKANLQKMKEIEDFFWNNTEFQAKVCLRTNIAPFDCAKSISVMRYFDGTYRHLDPILFDPTFDNIPAVFNAAKNHIITQKSIRYAIGKNYTMNATYASANIVRGLICAGMPLLGFRNATDRYWKQFRRIKYFFVSHFRSDFMKLFEQGVGEMKFLYNSYTLFLYALLVYVLMDLALFIGSIVFIMSFLLLQTGSFWVSGWAVYGIMTGFFGANLFYRIVLDYIYLGLFQILALFILLCIGADDIFVFYDTWKSSEKHKYLSLAHRLSYCYRKAAAAMFFTSLTTAVAFCVSAASPLLGMRTFGLFSALLICVNYISVIVYFPTVIVSYHVFWENSKCCCCPRDVSDVTDVADSTATAAAMTNHDKLYFSIVEFFSGPYFRFITHRVARWVILAFFAVLISTAIYYDTCLEINDEPEVKILKEKTNFGSVMIKKYTMFVPDKEFVMLVWGLKNQDLSRCHRTDYKCMGDTVWDKSFNINSPGVQQALLDLCRKLKTMSKTDRRRLFVIEDTATGQVDVDCFIDDMKSFYQTEQDRTVNGRRVYPSNTSLTVPVGELDALLVMKHNPLVYTLNLPQNFSRYFEVAMSFWLFNAFQPPYPSEQFLTYTSLIGEHSVPSDTVAVHLPSGEQVWTYEYGTRLSYAAIKIRTSMTGLKLGFEKGLSIRHAWEELLAKEKKNMPAALHGGFQMNGGLWHWLKVQKVLMRSAVAGVFVGLAVALPIFIIATGNIITGLLATCSVVFNTLCVIAVIPLGGWKLGVTESINLTLIVGLSVDYVVHLAQGYSRSSHISRLGRLHDSLSELGLSVLSGALTTVGGSSFLLLAKITYFVQFGLIMFATILFSMIFALGFLSTLLGFIGPEGDSGAINLGSLWNAVTFNTCKKETIHPMCKSASLDGSTH